VKTLLLILGWIVAALLLLQLVRIDIPEPPKATPADEIQAPKQIHALLKRACYDCHSNSTRWPWYANIAPISFEVRGHVKDGRAWLNFNIWNRYDEKKQQERLKGIVKSINFKMPIPSYLWAHPEARLTHEEREAIKKWAQSQIKE